MRDSREKGVGMRDQDPPFQTLYKICMQKFCRASFCQIHYKNNTTKLVSKCAGGINKQLLKTLGFDVLSSMKKLQKPLGGETSPPPPPAALIRPRVKLEFPALNVNSGEEREKTAVLAG